MRSTRLLLIAFVLALVGCSRAPDGPVLVVVVTASFPGANPQVVSDTVAAPIEQQIDGVEGMVRIESECRSDGSYIAWVRLGSQADAQQIITLVQCRVSLAKPVLPELVAQNGVDVKIMAAPTEENKEDKKPVVIALTDRGDDGRAAVREWSDAVVRRITAEGVLVKPELFPGPDEKLDRPVRINRERCKLFGLAEADVFNALRTTGGWAANLDALKKQMVTTADGHKVSLADVAVFDEVMVPAAVYRVDLCYAVRITGFPPPGKTAAAAARACVELAEAERKASKRPDGFRVVNLTTR